MTDYGDRSDLVLLAGFDQRRLAYLPYAELRSLAAAHALQLVDNLSPAGDTLAEQIDRLLASLAGTDQEGSVLTFEQNAEVIYRVKVKSPDYLMLMRALAECTYERTVALLDANPGVGSWEEMEELLRRQGREQVPEEVLGYFRPHYLRFQAYLADCDRLRQWAERVRADLEAVLGGRENKPPGLFRKSFAALAMRYPCSNLLFTALDGRLNQGRVRQFFRSPEEARQAVTQVEAFDPERMRGG